MAASTVATRVLLVQGMNIQARGELAHEVGEFQALARQTAAAGHGRPGLVLALLKTRTQQAVLEPDTVLIGLIRTRVVATSSNYKRSSISVAPSVRAAWADSAAQRTGTTTIAIGPAAGPVRYTLLPVRVAGDPAAGTFIAAVRLGPSLATISRVTRLEVETGGIALLIGTVLAWLIAGRVLRPVRDTTELARQITDTDISGRIPVRGRNEISELADTFNRMLDRLEGALTTQRRFLADAGHELRTPLTIIQGNLDTLEPTTSDDAETLSIAASELNRMSRLVTELTLLASSERPDFLHGQATDAESFTAEIVAKARRLADRPWLLTATAQGMVELDPQRMTQAVMQLAANAAAHTPAGTEVEISSAITGRRLEFTVSDHGPGIPRADRDRIFERFARLDTPRTDGTGLGLSIVSAITAAHGGTVRVSDTPGGGASLTISVPLVMAVPDAGAESTQAANGSSDRRGVLK